MKNTASKQEAINLINHAMKNGFTRKVEVSEHTMTNSKYVTVELNAEFKRGGLFRWAMIFVTFKNHKADKYRRASSAVSITSRSEYQTKFHKGLWDAQNTINSISETKKHFEYVPTFEI